MMFDLLQWLDRYVNILQIFKKHNKTPLLVVVFGSLHCNCKRWAIPILQPFHVYKLRAPTFQLPSTSPATIFPDDTSPPPAMHSGNDTALRHLSPTSQTLLASAHFDIMHNDYFSTFHHHLIPTSFLPPAYSPTTQFHIPPTAAQSSDDAEEHQGGVVDERKQRRMISNRESARRSRMRKQRHLDELWSQVVRLRAENRQLIDRLNDLSECHERTAQENAKLKEEASHLHQALKEMQLENPFAIFRDLEGEVPCNSSNQSIVTSTDELH